MLNNDVLFISVIIPTYNDPDRLRQCLTALEWQSYPAENYEVIVVDNGSAVSLESIVSLFDHAVLARESKRGSYAARNTGIAAANGDYFAFTDSDCIPEPDWLEKGVSYLREFPDSGLVGGRVDVFPATNHPTGVELFEMLYAFQVEMYINQRNYAPTCNLFTTRKVFNRVGLFNPDLPSGGDTEWGQRVFAMQYPQIYAQDVVIRHPARRTLQQILKKHRRIATGRAIRLQAEESLTAVVKHPLFKQGIIPKSNNRFIRKLRDSDYTLIQKVHVFFILVLVYFVSISERFRQLFFRSKRNQST